MLQSILNIVYRYPRATLRKFRRFGGYFNYLQMRSDQARMEKAALDLPPVYSSAYGLPIYFLTGKKYLGQTLFCIQSLTKVTREKFRFILVDDGSLDEPLMQRIGQQLPDAAVITPSMIRQNLETLLPEHLYPVLHRKRQTYPHIKKLTDVHSIPGLGWKLVLDSDMLFWKTPEAILTWLRSPQKPLYLKDCQESYGYSKKLMKELCAHEIPALLNVGVIGLNSREINWEAIEHWTRVLETEENSSYYLEQALTAMILAGKSCEILDPGNYIVNPDKTIFFEKKSILHHYVDLSKEIYYTHAWKNI